MKTPYSCFFAAAKRRARFSTVLFSLTLAPTRPQETPFSLRTSFCGSMTTSAVAALLNFIVILLLWTAAQLMQHKPDAPAKETPFAGASGLSGAMHWCRGCQ